MRRIFLLSLGLSIFLLHEPGYAQDINFKILSENKEIWSESGNLNELLNERYLLKIDIIKSGLIDDLKEEFHAETNRTTRAESFTLAPSTLTLHVNAKNDIFLRCLFSGNTVEFRATTPDLIFGIGTDRDKDPRLIISYDIWAEFPLTQIRTVESLRFSRPTWEIKLKSFSSDNMDNFAKINSLDKSKVELFVRNRLLSVFKYTYDELDDIYNSFNEYLRTSVKINPVLLAELEIDENRHLEAFIENEHLLVFKHNHSPTGMVKRASTKDAKIIMNAPKSTTSSPPVSTSPSGIGKSNKVLNSPKSQKPTIK